MAAKTTVTFNNGNKFPQLGLGTLAANKEELKTAVRAAIDAGYRHIDTAAAYGNEGDIGEVLQEYFKAGKLKREDIKITTKLWITNHQPERVPQGLDKSLKALQLDYVDLFLIHTPCAYEETGIGAFWPTREDGKPAFINIPLEDTWKAVEKLAEAGKAKNIGVSNFNSKQVERICKIAKIKPVTNQVECHAYFNQSQLGDFCKKLGVTLTSYGSLGAPGRRPELKKADEPTLMEDPVIKKLAEKYKKSPGQICLRYLVERGILIIPKSSNPTRIQQNAQLFDFKLTSCELKEVNGLNKNMRYYPTEHAKDHPEYPCNIPF